MFDKFISYLGVALAICAFFFGNVSNAELMYILIVTIIACFVCNKLWTWLSNLNYKWLDFIYFHCTRNPNNFKLIDKIITFDIESVSEAKYNVKADVVQTKNSNDKAIYTGRYCWPQSEDIIHRVMVNDRVVDNNRYKIGEDIKWSTISIFSNGIMHKNDHNKIEYSLENLHINNIKYHKFLSCKVIEKINNLQLNIKIAPEIINEVKAEFIIQNSKGDVVSRTPITDESGNNEFFKTIHKPRIGRKYIIKLS